LAPPLCGPEAFVDSVVDAIHDMDRRVADPQQRIERVTPPSAYRPRSSSQWAASRMPMPPDSGSEMVEG